MKVSWALPGAFAGLIFSSAVAMAQPVLPACDSSQARTGVDAALQKSKAPFTITDYAGVTTDRQTSTEVDCLAIATLSNGSHRPIGYKFRIYDGRVQSWIGVFVLKGAK
jgi:hypothetical protein